MSPAEESMSKPIPDEAAETAPDSGPEPLRTRAEPTAAEEFESEEERRFFSAPPAAEEEHSLPSLEPVVAEAGDEAAELPVPSAEQREWLARGDARRATLQRWVGLVMVAGAAALLVGTADRYLSSKPATASGVTSAVLHLTEPPPHKKNNASTRAGVATSETKATRAITVTAAVAPSAPSVAIRVEAPSAVVAPTAPANAPLPAAAAVASSAAAVTLAPVTASSAAMIPSAAPVRPAPVTASTAAVAPSAAPGATATEGDAAGLREKARALLATGHSRDGVAFARAAVESDPLDARSYVLLGAGLQDLGDWAAARGVFQECTRKTTRGPSSACRYFARR